MTFEAILFDCDGVLVDSEAITCGVLRDMFEELGWRMTLQECMAHFVGHTVRTRKDLIEANTGVPFTQAWLTTFYERRNVRLENEITPIADVLQALQFVRQHWGDQMACASGADRFKINLMLKRVGLLEFFEGRIFSGHEVPKSKPFPDVYLAAAAFLNKPANRCLAIEDTPIGVAAGVAAGAQVWGYAEHGQDDALRAAGAAQVFTRMTELPALLAATF
jgi:HAD superfamily hydrolase (TIGR01509 family)